MILKEQTQGFHQFQNSLIIFIIFLYLSYCAVSSQNILREENISEDAFGRLQTSFQNSLTSTTRRSNDAFSRRTTKRPSGGGTSIFIPESSTRFPTFPIHSTTQRHPTTQNQLSQNAPSLNFTAEDFKGSPFIILWNKGRATNEASLPVKNLRDFTFIFVCNATFPVKWASRGSFGSPNWEMDEKRVHISEDIDINGNRNSPNVLHTIFLKITYDKDDSVPSVQEVYCTNSNRRYKPGLTGSVMTSVVHINKTVDSTLLFKVPQSSFQEDLTNIPMYSEPLGSNVGCLLDLRWIPQRDRFQCSSEISQNLTIDFEGKNCVDYASCERRFTNAAGCYGPGGLWNFNKISSRADIWQPDNPPPAGIIYCKQNNETSDSNTAVLPFFHSLPRYCPQDNPDGRLKLYIASDDNKLDFDELRNNFVSFCTTDNSSHDANTLPRYNPHPAEANYLVYAGENVTVTCIASYFHFSVGTRIWLRRSGSYNELAVVGDTATVVNRAQGSFNYTARVLVKDRDVTDIICENYLKQSAGFVRKSLAIDVVEPRNLTFVGGISQVAAIWNYSGQPDFILRCEADGDPRPVVSWRKQGKEVPSNVRVVILNNGSISELHFPSLKPGRFSVKELHGTYTCQAANRLDKIEKTFHVQHTSNGSSVAVVINQGESSVKVERQGSSIWYVWAIIVPLFVIAVIAIIAFLIWKIKRQSQELRLLSKAEVDEFNFGRPEFLQHHSSSEEVNNYAPYLPYNRGYEITKDQLEIEANEILGSGAYAVVLKGVVHRGSGTDINVAIKTAKPMDDISYFKALLSELKIMGFIGSHKNIVNLVGAYTRNIQNREIFIAIEYCDKGNLLAYLRDNRSRFTSQLNENYELVKDLEITRDSFVYPDREGLSTITLLKWAHEIATGMDFLSQKKVIHGDLAARNILLTGHLVAKIGDFGLSRQLFEYANYIKKQQSPLPWKWLALECLQDMRFSVKSDVWAYAVLLYEVFSLGRVPYPGHSYNDEFLDALVNGKRPSRPAFATKEVFDLMSNCWKENTDERPSFAFIQHFFKEMLNKIVPQEYMELHDKVTSPRAYSTARNDRNLEAESRSSSIYEDRTAEKTGTIFNLNPKNITARFKIGQSSNGRS